MSDTTTPTVQSTKPSIAVPNVFSWNKFIAWATSSTTILGVTTIVGTLGSVGNGTASWATATPILISAVLAALWPQLQASTRDDISKAVAEELAKMRAPAAGAVIPTVPPAPAAGDVIGKT